ncbi:MAG: TlpA family protein disulfide reductase [Pyrinomonadaceae bacterium]
MKRIVSRISSFLFTSGVLILSVSGIFAQNAKGTGNDGAEKQTAGTSAPKVIQISDLEIKDLLKPKGKPLLVNFWATWCIPCREEFPDLVEIDAEYKDKIDFITITLDDPAEINRDVAKFLASMKATMPTYLLYTPNESEVISSISKDWQGGLPFTVLYNEGGDLIHFKQGKIKPEVVRAELDAMTKTDKSSGNGSETPRR